MKKLFLFLAIITPIFVFSQNTDKIEIQEWILSKLNKYLPKITTREYQNEDGTFLIDQSSKQYWFFENGNLIRYVFHHISNKDGGFISDYVISGSYEKKTYFPICYYDSINQTSDQQNSNSFTLWSSKSATVKFQKYNFRTLVRCNSCENGMRSDYIDDENETKYLKGLIINDLTFFEQDILERLDQAFNDLKKYYPVPIEKY